MAQNFMTRSSEWNQLRTLEVVAVAELTYHLWCPLHLQHQYLSLQTMVMEATRTKIIGDGGTTGDNLSFQAVLWKFQRKICWFLLMLVSICPIKCKFIIFYIGTNNNLLVGCVDLPSKYNVEHHRLETSGLKKKERKGTLLKCKIF